MEQKGDIKWLIYGSLISADNPQYTEEQKQESMRRFELSKSLDEIDWEFVLEPFEDGKGVNKLVDLFK